MILHPLTWVNLVICRSVSLHPHWWSSSSHASLHRQQWTVKCYSLWFNHMNPMPFSLNPVFSGMWMNSRQSNVNLLALKNINSSASMPVRKKEKFTVCRNSQMYPLGFIYTDNYFSSIFWLYLTFYLITQDRAISASFHWIGLLI